MGVIKHQLRRKLNYAQVGRVVRRCVMDRLSSVRVLTDWLKDDGTTGQATGHLAIDCPGKDYRIGTLSKVNNIIYCKNDALAE